MDKKLAALINFTGNSYHWGCYGTSMEIYQSLLDRSYYVELFEAEDVHTLSPTPENIEQFEDSNFVRKLMDQNRRLYRLLSNADVVVVNGEGTLHRVGKAAINLLFIIYSAKVFFGKKVHLINCSFYPSGDETPNEIFDRLYGGVARVADTVVPREIKSKSILDRLNVKNSQGFDCLPRFIERHQMLGSASRNSGITISGGVNFSNSNCMAMARILNQFSNNTIPIFYLTGAKGVVAHEDKIIFSKIREICPDIQLAEAKSMRSWLDYIKQSSCFISARYHHTLAAASLGVPFVALRSNTPKINATMEMIGSPLLNVEQDNDVDTIKNFINDSLSGKTNPIESHIMKKMISLSENNFEDL
jgi:polysaccharide pyruvyl transferase WcaK-like protein